MLPTIPTHKSADKGCYPFEPNGVQDGEFELRDEITANRPSQSLHRYAASSMLSAVTGVPKMKGSFRLFLNTRLNRLYANAGPSVA